MGVFGFFAWLIRENGSRMLSNKTIIKNDDNLYLDFNGGIHPAVRSKVCSTNMVF